MVLQHASRADDSNFLCHVIALRLLGNGGKLDPLFLGLGTLDDGLDERHPDNAVANIRIVVTGLAGILARNLITDGHGRGIVNIGEGLDESFGMTERDTGVVRRSPGHVVISTSIDLPRSASVLDDQIVGLFLMPFQGFLGPVDPDVKIVLVAIGNLRGINDPSGSALEAHAKRFRRHPKSGLGY